MQKVSEIRSAFLNYFAQNDHKIVKSAPLIPENDPTLLFVNAGMVPFKHYFTGELIPTAPRLVTSQKCVRAGGKHNDLENVGYTARHHTFFEMLGNFSFGDYFKEEAIYYAWNFLTKELALDPAKLLVTVYHTDDEATKLWKKIAGIREDKILKIGTNDNFWSMGDVGPCGPCSEIFYDHGAHIPGSKPGQGDEGDRFVEIWNLVFMQYQMLKNGDRIDLPKHCIDTGMGLERVASIMQGKSNNYDIDLFQEIIEASIQITGNNSPDHIASHRVIADHLRSSCFLIADGITASNEGRGYVVRRIIRRAIRHINKLGGSDNVLTKLAPYLIDRMGKHFDELEVARASILAELSREEESFSQTLDKGIKILDSELSNLKGNKLSGEVAFKLYDTYGFPLDLTQDILREKNLVVDEEGFNSLMKEQKVRAKANWKGSGDVVGEELYSSLTKEISATEFLGYDHDSVNAEVKSIIVNNQVTDKSSEQESDIYVITDKTVFYAESGGQIGDSGLAISANCELEILDCQKKLGGLFVHRAKIKSGELVKGAKLDLAIDQNKRIKIRANHSATHLLHSALKDVLGNHVTQKGSFVNEELLRFDFSHNKSLSKDEIAQIEQKVNQVIWQNVPAKTEVMKIDDAKAKGAVAQFGEKYDDVVRVVSFVGATLVVAQPNSTTHSIELCGGTHVSHTGDIAIFKIISEGSVASGIRRIEAVTREAAFTRLSSAYSNIVDISLKYQIDSDKIDNKIDSLIQDKKSLTKAISKYKISEYKAKALASIEEVSGNKLFIFKTENLDMGDCRDLAQQVLKQGNAVVALLNVSEGEKVAVLLAKDPKITSFNAGELIRKITPLVGGKGGGGKADFAQGGGVMSGDLTNALSVIKKIISDS
ncbi:MAG: alanine--tRNA ligase [Rickettsiales bacterium]|jgi:alanyl-tRNA synthetase|nr:alanine--tRNA ligase [Rickettsiales bacterium]